MTNRRLGVKIPRTLVIHLPRLLHMEYTVPELARELDCTPKQIRTLLTHGCPHRHDEQDKVWIVGTEFAEWARATLQKNRRPMEPDQAWCMCCNKPVKMAGNLTVRPTNKYLELVTGLCPDCGATVNRARRARRD